MFESILKLMGLVPFYVDFLVLLSINIICSYLVYVRDEQFHEERNEWPDPLEQAVIIMWPFFATILFPLTFLSLVFLAMEILAMGIKKMMSMYH